MIINLSAKTPIKDAVIDFIEVRLNTGEVVSLNWDESGIDREEGGFVAQYKGIYFDEEYANGRITDLEGMIITHIEVYSEEPDSSDKPVEIVYMRIDDGSTFLEYEPPITLIIEEYITQLKDILGIVYLGDKRDRELVIPCEVPIRVSQNKFNKLLNDWVQAVNNESYIELWNNLLNCEATRIDFIEYIRKVIT